MREIEEWKQYFTCCGCAVVCKCDVAIPLLLIVVGVIGRIDFELTNDVSRLDFDSSVLGEVIGDDIFGWI